MNNNFSTTLINKRQEKNMSQEDLAKKLYVSRQTISKWEKGESVPDIQKAKVLSEIFDVDLAFLIDGNNKVLEENERLKNLEDRVVKLESKDLKKATNGWDIVKYLICLIGVFVIGVFLTSALYFVKH